MKKRKEEDRAQGTFEYVLLLGGILLIVVLAIFMLTGTFKSASRNTETYAKMATGEIKPVTTQAEAISAFVTNFPGYSEGDVKTPVETSIDGKQFIVSASKTNVENVMGSPKTFSSTTIAWINKETGTIDETLVTN